MFAEIVFPIPLRKSFAYNVPSKLAGLLAPGKRVEAPFGSRVMRGYVISLSESLPADIPESRKAQIKDIYSLTEEQQVISDELMTLAKWISETYVCSMGITLDTIMPASLFSKKTELPQTVIPEQKTGQVTGNREIYVLTDRITENAGIYLKKAAEYGSCLLLVPEIYFIDELLRRFSSLSFDMDKICIWHTGMPVREKYKRWLEILEGRKNIVIGTRSAVFMPFKSLELIIIGNEPDQSYKETQKPSYNTINVALKRAENSGADVILESRIPSIETYLSLKRKKYRELPV